MNAGESGGAPLITTEADALAAWARRVAANREQAERLREPQPHADFYAPMAANFRADPRRTDEPALDILRGLVVPGEQWLDIGAGAGRYALPIALIASEVVAIDHSPGMLAELRDGMAAERIANIRIVEGSWPQPTPMATDVAFIAHVGYDIEGIGPFLDAMERSARRLCVAMLLAQAPASAAAPLWPIIHGEDRHLLPALPEFLALQLARGRLCEVRLTTRDALPFNDRERMSAFWRQQLFLSAGSEKDRRVQDLVARGQATVDSGAQTLGIVSWRRPA